MVEQDTFEHVTDFESASDHVMTLEKFQDLHMPVSLLSKVNYSNSSKMEPHKSPFERDLDNTAYSEGVDKSGVKQFRHKGPSLAAMTESEFAAYLKSVQQNKGPVNEVRNRIRRSIVARRRKEAQDKGEDLQTMDTKVSDADIMNQLRQLRDDPTALGPLVFELFDLPSPPPVPKDRIRDKYFEPPGTKLSSSEYAVAGAPKTHPSAGLSYQRTLASLYNHPKYGPQAAQRPVEARILRPKGRFRGRVSKAVAGVAGITMEDLNAVAFSEQSAPAGLSHFDASIPGGGKYWVSPIRTYIDPEGRISLASTRASATARAPYGIEDYQKPTPTRIFGVARGENRTVGRLDQPRGGRPAPSGTEPRQSMQDTEDIARNLMKTFNRS